MDGSSGTHVEGMRTVMVEFSTELVEQLGEWSEPVQVKVEQLPDGRYTLVTRNSTDEIDRLRAALDESERYAKEGWDWLSDALDAAGWKTVFDIPKKATT